MKLRRHQGPTAGAVRNPAPAVPICQAPASQRSTFERKARPAIEARAARVWSVEQAEKTTTGGYKPPSSWRVWDMRARRAPKEREAHARPSAAGKAQGNQKIFGLSKQVTPPVVATRPKCKNRGSLLCGVCRRPARAMSRSSCAFGQRRKGNVACSCALIRKPDNTHAQLQQTIRQMRPAGSISTAKGVTTRHADKHRLAAPVPW